MKEQNYWNDNEEIKVHNLSSEEHSSKDTSNVLKMPTPFIIEEKVQEPIIVENKLIAWCLPAINETIIDPLYGERRIVKWDNKFSFETIIIERDRVFLTLWAQMGDIPRNSIVYLYNGTKQVVGEWWKVMEVQPDEGGILIKCVPSTETPSFQ